MVFSQKKINETSVPGCIMAIVIVVVVVLLEAVVLSVKLIVLVSNMSHLNPNIFFWKVASLSAGSVRVPSALITPCRLEVQTSP